MPHIGSRRRIVQVLTNDSVHRDMLMVNAAEQFVLVIGSARQLQGAAAHMTLPLQLRHCEQLLILNVPACRVSDLALSMHPYVLQRP